MIDEFALDSFPGLFCSTVYVKYNAQKRKNIEKWGKAGLIHHASGGCRGERADVPNMYQLSLKAGFLLVKTSCSFNCANI